MDNALDYIFRALGKSERSIQKLAKGLARQRSISRSLYGMALGAAVYALFANLHTKQLSRRTEKLEHELNDLKFKMVLREMEEEEA